MLLKKILGMCFAISLSNLVFVQEDTKVLHHIALQFSGQNNLNLN